MNLRGFLCFGYNWVAQICDPFRAARGLRGIVWYVSDYRAYKKLPGAEPMRVIDTYPAVHERYTSHEIDAHYLFVNSWAIRLILKGNPKRHVDVASQTVLVALLSAVIPVTYLDYRSLGAKLSGLDCMSGSVTDLPFEDDAIGSLSCLHVAEHIGLGRYGDPLNPEGTRKAAEELQRVLSPGGNLYFAVPVGRPRLCFNAHRVHSAETICEYFGQLELVEYSGVHDDGRFVENVDISEFTNSDYACGMFHFRKTGGMRS